MRIGELAQRTGTTPRTIRYYEEIGLLGPNPARAQGEHRAYTDSDLERVQEIVRLKDLLGLSLDQLRELLEAETARAEIRRELKATDEPVRRRELLTEAQTHIDTQLRLVKQRLRELNALERELTDKQQRVADLLADRGKPGSRPQGLLPMQ